MDDLFKAYPERVPRRPEVGFAPKITDAERVTLALMQAVLGHTNEDRWLGCSYGCHRAMFLDLPGPSGFKRAAPQADLDDDDAVAR